MGVGSGKKKEGEALVVKPGNDEAFVYSLRNFGVRVVAVGNVREYNMAGITAQMVERLEGVLEEVETVEIGKAFAVRDKEDVKYLIGKM